MEKWERTGLLEGLGTDATRNSMARILENQAAQLLKEATSMAAGQVEGFASVAFPIVRRVFGGLVANELVSIQPMSLPSGLLFYLDYTYGSVNGTTSTGSGAAYTTGSSIYNNPAGKGVRSGSNAVGGQYDLAGTGFSRNHTSVSIVAGDIMLSGSVQNASDNKIVNVAAAVIVAVADVFLLVSCCSEIFCDSCGNVASAVQSCCR